MKNTTIFEIFNYTILLDNNFSVVVIKKLLDITIYNQYNLKSEQDISFNYIIVITK